MPSVTVPTKPAPPDLRLVQDAVNSRELDPPADLWRDPRALGDWLAEAGLGRGEATAQDLRRAVRFREGLRALLEWHNGRERGEEPLEEVRRELGGAAVATTLTAEGEVVLTPSGSGVDRLVSAVAIALAIASVDGRLERLKACANDACRYAFYDATKNRSGRWCTMTRCGNQLAARAYRRRRAAG